MSSETRPIKVTNLDSEKIRANEIAIENSKTGKVTAVVAVIYFFKDKLCNSRSAKREPLAKDHQKLVSKSKKSKRLASLASGLSRARQKYVFVPYRELAYVTTADLRCGNGVASRHLRILPRSDSNSLALYTSSI